MCDSRPAHFGASILEVYIVSLQKRVGSTRVSPFYFELQKLICSLRCRGKESYRALCSYHCRDHRNRGRDRNLRR